MTSNSKWMVRGKSTGKYYKKTKKPVIIYNYHCEFCGETIQTHIVRCKCKCQNGYEKKHNMSVIGDREKKLDMIPGPTSFEESLWL